ncbi:translocator protein, LysE family [Synechococcus sp. PCC 7335]|uniref:LysE family translocator n=1 Tax=Synechococcus sp. (strain ATCC 29403 / PCC 7335) TaxID=91464 RepID=UPI00017ECAA2|nr:LysE family translocator [Synechococcus sp. PCC 7335]EDX86579.1 translocator protein, LysE family [Synechococcus sp. PCC 7335]
MIDLTTLISFGLAAAVLVAMPGPATLYIVTRSLDQGRQAGLASVLGISTGSLVHFFAAGLGLSTILMTSVVAFQAVKYIGALYLIYLGVQKLLSNEVLSIEQVVAPRSLTKIFYQGVVVNVLNPKAAVFFLAFLPQFIDPTVGPIWQQLIPLCCVFICIGLAGDSTYALIAGKTRQWLVQNASFLRRQKYVVGATYIALGMAAATVSPARK